MYTGHVIWYDVVDSSSASVLLAGGRLYKAAEPRGWDLVCVKSNTKWLAVIVVFYVNRNIIYMHAGW